MIRGYISHIFASTSRASRAGFTLLELLIFAGLFALVIIGFITILVAVTRVQSRQSAAAEVNQQSQFLLQQFQYYVNRSSLVEMPKDAASTTLTLRMANGAEDPTLIWLSGGAIYLKKGADSSQALTSDRVNVANLTFTKRANPPGHDSVDISFLVEYDVPNTTYAFSQSLKTAIARVNAASFDSNVLPSSTATYDVGVSGSIWRSMNQILYFSGSNVGIGTASPASKLQVSGGNVYIFDTNATLIMRDPVQTYCWSYRPTTLTGAWNISSSTCP